MNGAQIVIGLLFFLVVAIVIFLGISALQNNAKPHIIVTSSLFLFPMIRYSQTGLRKKGLGSVPRVLQYFFLIVLGLVVSLSVFAVVVGGFDNAISIIVSGFTDFIGIA